MRSKFYLCATKWETILLRNQEKINTISLSLSPSLHTNTQAIVILVVLPDFRLFGLSFQFFCWTIFEFSRTLKKKRKYIFRPFKFPVSISTFRKTKQNIQSIEADFRIPWLKSCFPAFKLTRAIFFRWKLKFVCLFRMKKTSANLGINTYNY